MRNIYLYAATLGLASVAFLAFCGLIVTAGTIRLRYGAPPGRALRLAAAALVLAGLSYAASRGLA